MRLFSYDSKSPQVAKAFGYTPNFSAAAMPLARTVDLPARITLESGATFTPAGDGTGAVPLQWRAAKELYEALPSHPRGELPAEGSDALQRRLRAFERELIGVSTCADINSTFARLATAEACDLAASFGVLGHERVTELISNHFLGATLDVAEHCPRSTWDVEGAALDKAQAAQAEQQKRAEAASRKKAEQDAALNTLQRIDPRVLGLGFIVEVAPRVQFTDADGRQRARFGIGPQTYLATTAEGKELHAIRMLGRSVDPGMTLDMPDGFEVLGRGYEVMLTPRAAIGALGYAAPMPGFGYFDWLGALRSGDSGGAMAEESLYDASSFEGCKRIARAKRILADGVSTNEIRELVSAFVRGLELGPEVCVGLLVPSPKLHTASMHAHERITGEMSASGHTPTVGGPDAVAERYNDRLRTEHTKRCEEIRHLAYDAVRARNGFEQARYHRPGELDGAHVVWLQSEESAARAIAAASTSNKFAEAVFRIVGGQSELRSQVVYDALAGLGLVVNSNEDKAAVSEALELAGFTYENTYDQAGKRGRMWTKREAA